MQKPQALGFRSLLAVAILAALTISFSLASFSGSPSPDLRALWTAAEFYNMGAVDQIYPHDTTHFTMRPPSAWIDHLRSQGEMGDVFPYIYPPIWTALTAPLTQVTQFATIQNIALVINSILLTLMIFFAWRASERSMAAWTFVAIGLVIILGTTSGMIALMQNQPQILVSFLIVIAIERSINGNSNAAGIALGLAAAIKLYPILFAIFLWARGDRRSVAVCLIFGGLLGLLSIALTGWPLHAAFLTQVSSISKGVLITPINYSLDGTLGNLITPENLDFIAPLTPSTSPSETQGAAKGWYTFAKPALWRAMNLALGLTAVTWLTLTIRKRPDDVAFWPMAVTLISLLMPLSWVYHFLTSIAFAPLIFGRFPLRIALRILALIFIPNMLGLLPYYHKIPTDFSMVQLLGFLMMLSYTLVWAHALRNSSIKVD